MLTIEPALAAAAGAWDRLAEVLTDERTQPVAGLLPVLDWRSEPDEVAIVRCALPAVPTLADLSAEEPVAGGVDPTVAVVVLHDVGSTLRRLARDGRRHGRLRSGDVVLCADGTARLREAGWHAALIGASTPTSWDVAAWQRVALGLADRLDDRVFAAPTESPRDQALRALVRSVGEREPDDGPVDLDGLLEELAEALDADEISAARRTVSALAVGIGAAADASETSDDALPGNAAPGLATIGLAPSGAVPPELGAGGAVETDAAAPAAATTVPPPRAPSPAPSPPARVVLRFGPGVPAVVPGRGPAPRRQPRRAWKQAYRALAWAATATVVAMAVWLLWPAGDLSIRSVSLAAQPPSVGCGTPADLVATVRTDGDPGTLRYRWVRSDGVRTGVLDERLTRGQELAELHLRWDVVGPGAFEGEARLEILEPAVASTTRSVAFTYRCAG